MPWYLIRKQNGAYQKYYALKKPASAGEIVYESEDLRAVIDELMRLEAERFDAEEG